MKVFYLTGRYNCILLLPINNPEIQANNYDERSFQATFCPFRQTFPLSHDVRFHPEKYLLYLVVDTVRIIRCLSHRVSRSSSAPTNKGFRSQIFEYLIAEVLNQKFHFAPKILGQ